MSDEGGARSRRAEILLSATAAALLVAQQVGSKATRDALFLSSFDPRRLPIAMASGAVLSLLAVLAMARALSQQGPARVLPWALLVNATFFGIEWVAEPTSRDGVAVALYLHIATLGSVLVSGFWSLVSERFDPHRARAHVPRIAAGATFGGVIGGVVAHFVGSNFGARTMLLVLGGASLLAAAAIVRIGGGEVSPSALTSGESDPRGGSVGTIARTPFLRALAAMSMLAAVWEALLDFAFKAQAGRTYTEESSLVTFFAVFYTVTSLITFVFQTAFGNAILQRLRVESSLRVLPIFVSAAGLGLLFGSPFWLLGVVRGGESVLSNSIFRAAYELLFTPLPRATKRPTKTLVDVAATRIGDAAGSLLVLVLIQSWRDMPVVVPVVIAAGAALITLLLVDRVRENYVEALESALRAGVVDLEESPPLDATTRRTLNDTTTALDRERLLAQIDELRRAAETKRDDAHVAAVEVIAAHPAPEVEAEVPAITPPPADVGLVSRFAAIASGAADRARAALAEPLEPELVPVVIPLLAHPQLGPVALDALRRTAPRVTGALVDALLDPRTRFEVRFRIPRALRAAPSPRAAHGLVVGLGDPRLEVRLQCARALVHLASTHPDLAPSADSIFTSVERELAERGATWSAVARPEEEADEEHHEDEPISLDELVRMRASRSLQYVLTLLSLVVDGEALQLALRGLSSPEEKIRGTAIELLENVLPEPVRASLVSVLETRGRAETRTRPREEIVAELLRSQESLPLVKPRPA